MTKQAIGQISVVDLAGGSGAGPRRRVAADLDMAFRQSGFAVVVNHGIHSELIAVMDSVCRSFFTLPLESKMACAASPESRFRGYCSIHGGAPVGAEPVELWESFEMNRFDGARDALTAGYESAIAACFAPNLWPPEPPGFRRIWEEYFAAMEGFADYLFSLAELALGAEAGSMSATMERHWSYLCANWYPAQAETARADQVRQVPHTDIATFTVLYQDHAPGTVEALSRGIWVPAPRVPSSLIINVGDLLSRWTNGRWPATWHRVQAPRSELLHSRLSIPFFTYPDAEFIIAPLKNQGPPVAQPVRVKEYVELRQSGVFRPEAPA